MQEILDGFVFSLVGGQAKSGNTIMSYKRDIAHYLAFLKEKGISDIKKTNRTTVLSYLLLLQKQGRSAATAKCAEFVLKPCVRVGLPAYRLWRSASGSDPGGKYGLVAEFKPL